MAHYLLTHGKSADVFLLRIRLAKHTRRRIVCGIKARSLSRIDGTPKRTVALERDIEQETAHIL